MATATLTAVSTSADRHHLTDPHLDSLAERLATADEAERAALLEQIVLTALPMADAIARRYRRRGIEADDLQQVARTALVKAATRYRPGVGSGFVAFAAPSISGELKRWFRDHGWSVRPPRRIQELRALLVYEEEELRHTLQREPLDHEIAERLGVTEKDITEVRACANGYHAASLDAPSEAGTSLAERTLVTPSECEGIEIRDALRCAVRGLDERQRLVLRLRFVEDLTQSEIGERIGVSQMQVSRILSTVLSTLRASLEQDDAERTVA
jgi:RNA polymerase sigma-B factor